MHVLARHSLCPNKRTEITVLIGFSLGVLSSGNIPRVDTMVETIMVPGL